MEIFLPGQENSVVTCGKECQYFIDHPKELPRTGQDLHITAFIIVAIITIPWTIIILIRRFYVKKVSKS